MTKANYMALADLQTVWDNDLKPYVSNTYVAKTDITYASVETCRSIISELI